MAFSLVRFWSYLASLANPALITFLGAIIAAIGVYWASVRNAASQREIVGLNRQLAAKNDELAKLNQKIADLVTGGNAFAVAQLVLGGSDLGRIYIFNNTEYPLYELSIRLEDLADLAKMEELKAPMTWATIKPTFVLNTLGPHMIMGVGPIKIASDVQELRYNFVFSARNGGTTEYYRARKVNGQWKVAILVTRNDASKEKLYEKIDPELPHPSGSLDDW